MNNSPNSLRILIAVHGFPPTHTAGAERRAERMARWLTANGHSVEVFTVEKVDETSFRMETGQQDGFTVHRLFYNIHNDNDPLINFYDYPPIGDALRQVLSQKHFDVIHMVSGYLLGNQVVSVAHEFDTPSVITLTEFWFMCARLNLIRPDHSLCQGPESITKCTRCLLESKRRYRLPAQVAPALMDIVWPLVSYTSDSQRIQTAVERRITTLSEVLEAADLVICPSKHLIKKFNDFGFSTERFHYLRQGLVLTKRGEIGDHSHNTDTLRLGYSGQIKPHKGVDLLLDAVLPLIEARKPVSLQIWGPENEDPAYVQGLKRRSAGYADRVQWRGRYAGDQVWDILADIDVLVVPSRWYENSPNVILEAYAMGIPVIATNLGGMAELVGHEKSGLLFELNNAADLRDQIRRLLNEPALLPRLQSGIPVVKSLDDEMRGIIAEYRKLLAVSV